MRQNVSMFDVHCVPPMFPCAPPVDPTLKEGDRSLAFVLFVAKAIAATRKNSRSLPISALEAEMAPLPTAGAIHQRGK